MITVGRPAIRVEVGRWWGKAEFTGPVATIVS